MTNSKLFRPTLLVAVLSFSILGCSSSESDGPKTYPVTGVVTLAGKSVDGATIVFVPYDGKGKPASAVSDAEGKYKLTTTSSGDGAVPGNYKIKVVKYDKPAVDASKMVRNMTYEEEQKAYNPDAKPAPPPKNLLPKKFESEQSSGLSHSVPEKASTYDIKLEGK